MYKRQQNARPDTDVFTGKKFTETTGEEGGAGFDVSMLTPEEQEYFMSLTDEEKAEFASAYMAQNATSSATLEGNLEKMGVADLDKPSAINIYPVDFESKEEIVAKIEEYNDSRAEADKIQYTDYISKMCIRDSRKKRKKEKGYKYERGWILQRQIRPAGGNADPNAGQSLLFRRWRIRFFFGV